MSSVHTVPLYLWTSYVDYLWGYKTDSWVATTAYTFRILAFLIAFPLILVALLDIAAYVIARTLGVIDDTKASTSDRGSFHVIPGEKLAHGAADIEPHVEITSVPGEHRFPPSLPSLDTSSTHPFFASEEKLSGVGEFSPATSRPPSPVLSRRQLPVMTKMDESSSSGSSAQFDDMILMKRRQKKGEDPSG